MNLLVLWNICVRQKHNIWRFPVLHEVHVSLAESVTDCILWLRKDKINPRMLS